MKIYLDRDPVCAGDDMFGHDRITLEIEHNMPILNFVELIREKFITSNLWMAKWVVREGDIYDRDSETLLVIDTENFTVDVVSDYLNINGWPPFMYFEYITPYREKNEMLSLEVKETFNLKHETITVEEVHNKKYYLQRFLDAQKNAYPVALREITDGRKVGHWIWHIFPQQKGLGHSWNSEYYGLDGEDEARAYIQHPILAERLREMCRALLAHKDSKTILEIMAKEIDVLKLKTSMTLFDKVAPNDVFKEVLEAFY